MTEKKKRRTRAEVIADLQAKEDAAQCSKVARGWLESASRRLRESAPLDALECAKLAIVEIERLIEQDAKAKREQELRSPQLQIDTTFS